MEIRTNTMIVITPKMNLLQIPIIDEFYVPPSDPLSGKRGIEFAAQKGLLNPKTTPFNFQAGGPPLHPRSHYWHLHDTLYPFIPRSWIVPIANRYEYRYVCLSLMVHLSIHKIPQYFVNSYLAPHLRQVSQDCIHNVFCDKPHFDVLYHAFQEKKKRRRRFLQVRGPSFLGPRQRPKYMHQHMHMQTKQRSHFM
jgi:hypothetical protein